MTAQSNTVQLSNPNAALAAALFLAMAPVAACGGSQDKAESTTPVAEAPAPVEPEPVADSEPVSTSACAVQDVLFGYDSADLSSGARQTISTNISCIRDQGASQVQVTGMTDPRGTEEYNLALGERRARSVSEYMQSLGLPQTEVEWTSVGEEFATGADEGGWAADRRAAVKAE